MKHWPAGSSRTPREEGVLQKELIAIALGEKPAEEVIRGGRVLNVYTGELILENVALWQDRVAYVGSSQKMIGRPTRIREAEGMILVPGYMDPHCHPDFFYNPAAFANEVVRTGTTSVFADMHDLANALGLAGILQVLKDAPRYPLTYYLGVPSSAPPFPRLEGGEKFSLTVLRGLLKRPEALGLVTGFGARLGAIASTMAHETHNILVLGFDDRDMARAVNMDLALIRVSDGLTAVWVTLPKDCSGQKIKLPFSFILIIELLSEN